MPDVVKLQESGPIYYSQIPSKYVVRFFREVTLDELTKLAKEHWSGKTSPTMDQLLGIAQRHWKAEPSEA